MARSDELRQQDREEAHRLYGAGRIDHELDTHGFPGLGSVVGVDKVVEQNPNSRSNYNSADNPEFGGPRRPTHEDLEHNQKGVSAARSAMSKPIDSNAGAMPVIEKEYSEKGDISSGPAKARQRLSESSRWQPDQVKKEVKPIRLTSPHLQK